MKSIKFNFIVLVLFLSSCSHQNKRTFFDEGTGPFIQSDIYSILIKNLEAPFVKVDGQSLYARHYQKDYLFGESLEVLGLGIGSSLSSELFLSNKLSSRQTSEQKLKMEFTSFSEYSRDWIEDCSVGRCLVVRRPMAYLVKGINGYVSIIKSEIKAKFKIENIGKSKEPSRVTLLNIEILDDFGHDPLKNYRNQPMLKFIEKRLITRGMKLEDAQLALNYQFDKDKNTHRKRPFSNIIIRNGYIYDYALTL